MTKTLKQSNISAMITVVEGLNDDQLQMEVSFGQGFAPTPNDPAATLWLALLEHEARTRGTFVPDEDYETIEDWLRDSDYVYCDGTGDECAEACGWVDHADNPVNPAAVYADAHAAIGVLEIVARTLDIPAVA
jgi:hypothetical protein